MKNNTVLIAKDGTKRPIADSRALVRDEDRNGEISRQSHQAYRERPCVSNITTVVWKADIGKNGTFENTYSSPVVDELLGLPAGTIKTGRSGA